MMSSPPRSPRPDQAVVVPLADQFAGGARFETPENILVGYQPAGLGTRFFAYILDSVFLSLIMLGLTLLLIASGVLADQLGDMISDRLQSFLPDPEDGAREAEQLFYVVYGLIMLVWGLGSFAYFFFQEYLLRGQTLGKKICSLRVVKADGFSLDAFAIFVRNIFRLVDGVAILWMVPFFSKQNQRLGDMVAGTLVIRDAPSTLSPLREHLASRASQAGGSLQFRVDPARLARLGEDDLEAMELLLERFARLSPEKQEELTARIAGNLSARLEIPPPDAASRLVFLQDLLAQAYARLGRRLG